jgi:Beta-galactosidase
MRVWQVAVMVLGVAIWGPAQATDGSFPKGPPQASVSFPLAVWLQAPANAERYRAIGINTYVGLWRGPTEEQLDVLDRAGIRLICGQGERSLRFKDRPTIVGWMHGDEPDNAQTLGLGKGYGPPVPPATIVEGYEKIRKADPDRPVLLNLGQGVAWDGWHGRGVRTNHPEDYPEYLKGSDIASFDIYPASHEKQEIAGKLWYVPQGVDRLRRWTGGRKDVWCCIETTRISNVDRQPTPEQVRSEVWMALIHGAKGIIYFAHQFQPKFIEAGLLADEAMARGVATLNRQVLELAPVLNSPDVAGGASVATTEEGVPIDFMVKRHAGETYLFAVAMREGETTATFTLPGRGDARVEVQGEGRAIEAPGGQWEDHFTGYQVHLYRIESGRKGPTGPSRRTGS